MKLLRMKALNRVQLFFNLKGIKQNFRKKFAYLFSEHDSAIEDGNNNIDICNENGNNYNNFKYSIINFLEERSKSLLITITLLIKMIITKYNVITRWK